MFKWKWFLPLILGLAGSAHALEKQTRRHPLCGVESYKSLANDSRCPVAQYIAKESPACAPIYKLKMDAHICGYDQNRIIRRCERMSGSAVPERLTSPDPELGCGNGYRLVETHPVASCRNEAFGIDRYEVCRAPAHGAEFYQTCSKPEFGIESYRACSFYKTPEELNAYIDATNETLAVYSQTLPVRKGELLLRLNNEAAMVCLVHEYEGNPAYEDVVIRLEEKFLAVFGYNVNDVVADCSEPEQKAAEIRFSIASIDCDRLNKDDIPSLAKPDGVSDNLFSRFKQNCTMKKSYDILVDWFETKDFEVSELLSDIAANSDPAAATRLRELQAKLLNK